MRLIDEAKVINEIERFKGYLDDDMIMRIKIAINKLPTIDAVEVVRCKDCRWFDKKTEHSSYGYCYAMRHGYLSKNWEITIYRTQKEDFYCADGEVKNEAY